MYNVQDLTTLPDRKLFNFTQTYCLAKSATDTIKYIVSFSSGFWQKIIGSKFFDAKIYLVDRSNSQMTHRPYPPSLLLEAPLFVLRFADRLLDILQTSYMSYYILYDRAAFPAISPIFLLKKTTLFPLIKEWLRTNKYTQ